MKKPEFLKLLKKEILPKFPDYLLFKDMLIHKSSNELFKFINFQVLSFGDIRCSLNLMPLFYPTEYFSLSYSEEVNIKKSVKSWNLDNANEELDKLEDMILKIKSVEKYFFNKINTSLDFYNYYNLERGGIRHEEGIMYSACYSLKNGFRDEITYFLNKYKEELNVPGWKIDCKEKAEMLLRLSLEDENLMIEQLKEWMKYSLVQLKLDKFYKEKLKFEI